MDEKQLQFLFNEYAKGKGFKDYNEFKSLMSNENSRRVFFDESNNDLGFKDFSDFDNTLGIKKKVSPLQAPSPSSAIPSLSQYIQKKREEIQPQTDRSLSQTSVFNQKLTELTKIQRYEDALNRKATADKFLNNANGIAVFPMTDVPLAIPSEYDKSLEDWKIEAKKYQQESDNIGKEVLPEIKSSIEQYAGQLTKDGVPDYGKIATLSRQISANLGGGDYVSEVIKSQLQAQERYAIVKPQVEKDFSAIVKKEKGLLPKEYIESENKKVQEVLIKKQLATTEKIKEATILADTEYKQKQNEVTERYKPLFQSVQTEQEYNDLVSQYYTEVRGIANKLNNRIKRTRDELINQFNSEIQKANVPNNVLNYLNDAYKRAYDNTIKSNLEAKKLMQDAEIKALGYTGILGKSFINGLMSGIANRGSGLVGLGLGGDFSDFLESFRTTGEQFETIDLEYKGNWFKPETYLTRLGKQVGYQVPSMAMTMLTRNPYIGGMAGYVDEQLQNGGDVYNQILSETNDPVKAQQATARYWYRTIPTIPLYFLESSMLLKLTGLKKGNVIANVFAEPLVEVPQELSQQYLQQLDSQNALPLGEFMKKEAPSIALDTAITSILQSGSFAALGKLGSTLTQNEFANNYIYNLLNSKGVNAAFSILELQQLNGQITPEQLQLKKENIQKVAQTITELKAVGLNNEQVEGYLALLSERDGMREKLTKTSNPELISAYQSEIEKINKELEKAALGNVKATTVEFTSGGKITILGEPKTIVGKLKDEIGNSVNVSSTDAAANQEANKIKEKIPQQENEELTDRIIYLNISLAENNIQTTEQEGVLIFTDNNGNIIDENALPEGVKENAFELINIWNKLNGNDIAEIKPQQNAIQEPSTESVLQRQQGEIGKAGGERQGMESNVEEQKTPEEIERDEKEKVEIETTATKLKEKELFKTKEGEQIGKLVPKKFYDKKKSAFQIVSEAYNQAKKDKSNPELVKAVNDFLDAESGRLPKDVKGRRVGNKKYSSGEKHIVGRTITKRTPTGAKIRGVFKLVPANQLIPSHNPLTFSKNEAFPQNESGKTINDRDYEKNESDKAAVISFAQTLDSRALENTPWVSKEGIVYNGNNRTMSRQLAAKNNTDTEYLNQLREQAEMYGFTEEQVNSMENPTLVFEVEKNLPFTTKVWKMFNVEEKKEGTPKAFAIAISKTISDRAKRELSLLYEEAETPSDVTSDPKKYKRALDILVQDGVIQAIEIPKYSDKGVATPEGVALLERVVLGASLDENSIETLMSAQMGNIKNAILKNIVGLMLNSTKGESSLIPDITGAVDILKKAKALNSSVLDFLVAFDIFGENNWTLGEMSLALLLELNSPNKLKEFLSAYNQDVGKQLMFGDSTKEGILTNLVNNIVPQYEKARKVIDRVAERGTSTTEKDSGKPDQKDEREEAQLMSGKVPNPIPEKQFDKLISKLQKAFPKAKITFNINDVKGKNAKEIKTKGGIIYGATLPDGTIFLNREAMSAEAPIHEFTHLWERLMPTEWARGLEYFKKTSGFAKAFNEINNNPAYKNLSKEQKESEAMNTILGRMGEGYFKSDTLLKEFKNWFTQLLKKVADKLGIRQLTPDDKFNEFANKVLGELLGASIDITPELKSTVEQGMPQFMAFVPDEAKQMVTDYDNLTFKNQNEINNFIKKYGVQKLKQLRDITNNFGTYITNLENSNYITKKIC